MCKLYLYNQMLTHIIVCTIVILVICFFVIVVQKRLDIEHFVNESTQNINGYVVTQNTDDNWEIKNPDQNFFNAITAPIGTIFLWGSTNIPLGWSLCDGSNGTPDLRGRFVLGNNTNDGQFKSDIGNASSGNLETHTMSYYEFPYHEHITQPLVVGNYIKSSCDCNRSDVPTYTTSSYECNWGTSEYRSGIPSIMNYVGNGKSHNNMPPYYVLAYIMRTS